MYTKSFNWLVYFQIQSTDFLEKSFQPFILYKISFLIKWRKFCMKRIYILEDIDFWDLRDVSKNFGDLRNLF